MLGAMTWRWIAAVGVMTFACHDNPNIDGSQVAPIGSDASPPDCPQVCTRLAALCGYAPGGDCTDEAGAGYCDMQLNAPDLLLCMGQAPSCQSAWDCVNNVPTT